MHENLPDLQISRGVICVNECKEREEAELIERICHRKGHSLYTFPQMYRTKEMRSMKPQNSLSVL